MMTLKFQTFTDNFQKGVDEDYDFPPNKEEKIEIKNQDTLVKRKRGCPKKVIIQEDSESDEDDENHRFPTM
jgi:hypothetical protein